MATAMYQPTPDPRHTWSGAPGFRAMNDGLGACNTGARRGMLCCFGGIGCDVDHIAIARDHLRAAGYGR